jgi:hypothetical protein
MKVYYAHCIAIYNTPQEERDVHTLLGLGLDVVNPNTPAVDVEVKRLKSLGENYMSFFKDIVHCCEVFAFRALPDGSIPAGVAKELAWAVEADKLIIELPAAILRRVITLEATREYLHEVGQR